MFNYPNGKKPSTQTPSATHSPNLKKSRLGIDFEGLINDSNQYYLNNNIAVIHKKPTPIQITKVDYPSRKSAKITEAFYKIPSTTDYNGIYKGKHIDFEAKSCLGKTFSLARIYDHQVNHLKLIREHGGISFLLIKFNDYDEVYLLESDKLVDYVEASKNGGRKSIPKEYFEEHGHFIKLGYNPIIDYLKVVDKLLEDK